MQAASSGGRSSTFIGVGAALTVVLLLILQALTSGGIFGTKTETVTMPSISISTATTITTSVSTIVNNGSAMTAIVLVFDNHLLNIQSVNFARLEADYMSNVTLLAQARLASSVNLDSPIAQDAEGFVGTYKGNVDATTFVVDGLVGDVFDAGHNMTMTIWNFSVQGFGNGSISSVNGIPTTNATIDLTGFGPYVGHASATVVLEDKYVQIGGIWMISNETWTVTNATELQGNT
jgi:hypothetical protein